MSFKKERHQTRGRNFLTDVQNPFTDESISTFVVK